MQSSETLFSGVGSSRRTMCMAGFGCAVAFGTLVVSFFLLVSVSRNIRLIKTRRHLRASNPFIKKEVSKILFAQGGRTAPGGERATKPSIHFSFIIPSGKKFTTKIYYPRRGVDPATNASQPESSSTLASKGTEKYDLSPVATSQSWDRIEIVSNSPTDDTRPFKTADISSSTPVDQGLHLGVDGDASDSNNELLSANTEPFYVPVVERKTTISTHRHHFDLKVTGLKKRHGRGVEDRIPAVHSTEPFTNHRNYETRKAFDRRNHHPHRKAVSALPHRSDHSSAVTSVNSTQEVHDVTLNESSEAAVPEVPNQSNSTSASQAEEHTSSINLDDLALEDGSNSEKAVPYIEETTTTQPVGPFPDLYDSHIYI